VVSPLQVKKISAYFLDTAEKIISSSPSNSKAYKFKLANNGTPAHRPRMKRSNSIIGSGDEILLCVGKARTLLAAIEFSFVTGIFG
jgi:hypothetical protein